MTTATEYRQYARECTVCARDATTDPIRNQFLDLAKLWLTAAARKDAQAAPATPTGFDGHAHPNLGGILLNKQG